MITFYNLQHALHHGKLEMFRGELVPCFEVPARAYFVLQKLARRGLGPVQPPQESSTPRTPPLPQPSDQPAHRPATVSALGFEATLTLTTIHTSRYLDFPAQAWAEWAALDPANAAKDPFPRFGRCAVSEPTCCPSTSPRAWVCSCLTRARPSPRALGLRPALGRTAGDGASRLSPLKSAAIHAAPGLGTGANTVEFPILYMYFRIYGCRKFLQSRWAFCTRVNENNDLHHWHGKCLANLDCPLAKAGAVNGLIGKIPGVPANY